MDKIKIKQCSPKRLYSVNFKKSFIKNINYECKKKFSDGSWDGLAGVLYKLVIMLHNN